MKPGPTRGALGVCASNMGTIHVCSLANLYIGGISSMAGTVSVSRLTTNLCAIGMLASGKRGITGVVGGWRC